MARPKSMVSGDDLDLQWGPNWDDDLAASESRRPATRTAAGSRRQVKLEFEQAFMMYLPRICEHCINPSCVASCPSGRDVQARGGRDRARRPGGVPLVALLRLRLPVQEGLLQLEHGQGREVQLLLPADRGGPADRLLGDLRRAPAPPGHRVDRLRPGRGGGLGARREGSARRSARPDARPRGPRGTRAGPPRRDRRGLDRGRAGARRCTRCASAGGSRCRCTPSTGPCRWSGTCRRCRRSRAWSRPTTASSTPSACSRPSTRCGSRSSTWPGSWRRATPSRCAARSRGWRRCAGSCAPPTSTAASTSRSPIDVGMQPAEIEAMFEMVAIGDYDDRYVIPKRHGEVSADAFAEQGSCGIDFSGVTATVRPRRRTTRASRTTTRRRSRPTSTCATACRSSARGAAMAERLHPLKLASLMLQYPSAELREAAASARELEISPSRGRQAERLHEFCGWYAPLAVRRAPARSTSTHSTSPSSAASTSPTTSTAIAASGAWRCWRSRSPIACAGFEPPGDELPDYLPLMLEFASLAPAGRGARAARAPPGRDRADPRRPAARPEPVRAAARRRGREPRAVELGQARADPPARRRRAAGRGGRASSPSLRPR